MKRSLGLVFLGLLPALLNAQNDGFWKPLRNTPGKDESLVFYSLVIDNLDNLFVGTNAGIYKSRDSGNSWERLSIDHVPIFQMAVEDDHVYAVSGSGIVYFSIDGGLHWDYRQLPNVEATTDILAVNGEVYVSTGHIEASNEVGLFRGNGIFKSSDSGKTWAKQSLGKFDNYYIGHLAVDSQYRIYASVNEYHAGDGAIIYSSNAGINWQTMPDISFNWGGENTVANTKLVQVTSLEIDQADKIRVSALGVSGSVATSFNVFNSFQDAVSSAEWNHMMMTSFGFPWFYLEGHNTFFARNGDVYACRLGFSFNLSGIYYSKKSTAFEKQNIEPVVIEGTPYYNYCFFAQQSNGRVYVLQQLDNVVYVTDSSVDPVLGVDDEFRTVVYPNPVVDYVHIESNSPFSSAVVEVIDSKGKQVFEKTFTSSNKMNIDFRDLPGGVYFVRVVQGRRVQQYRILK